MDCLYKERINMKKKIICTMCGKELDEFDIIEDLHFERYIGLGSRYDFNFFEADLCCKCLDKILDIILPMFKNNPLSEYCVVDDDGNVIDKNNKIVNMDKNVF